MTTNTQELKDFAKLLQDNGFTVIVSAKHPFEWLYFEKNGKLGTVSPSYYSGFNFGTVHKPCQACGIGYGITQDSELNLENAENSLVCAPYWASSRDVTQINKYKGSEDFIKNNAWAEYYVLSKDNTETTPEPSLCQADIDNINAFANRQLKA